MYKTKELRLRQGAPTCPSVSFTKRYKERVLLDISDFL